MGPPVVGALLGSLFLRTWDRADRVYRAMVARGFTGEVELMHPLLFGAADAALLFLGAGAVVAVGLW